MRIHLGCGPVYLEGFVNCDVKIEGHYLASERPDLVEKNKTTVDNYYKKNVTREQIMSGKFNKEDVVVDMYANVHRLPFKDNSIDEIRLYQVFEHFTTPEANELLQYWRRKLIDRGVLYLDVPDLAQTAYNYVNSQTEEDRAWNVRLLYGSQKNVYGLHKMMYSRESITQLLYKNGYNDLKFLPNIHLNKDGSILYPAFAVEAKKY